MVFTKHECIKLMLNKLQSPERLIKWLVALQEFNYELRTSPPRLQNLVVFICDLGEEFEWRESHLYRVDQASIPPWYASIAQYLSTLELRRGLSKGEKKKIKIQALRFSLIDGVLH